MKCMLIFPAWETKDYFLEEFGNSTTHRWHPLGLLYIAAALLKKGFDVQVVDGAFYSHEEIIMRYRKYNPDFVGIHANCPIWEKAVHTADSIRKTAPDVFISLGGPAAIGWREKCLKECSSLDCIFTGEGEYTVPELVEKLEEGGKTFLGKIKGIIYKDIDGEIIVNEDADPIMELDELPFPAFELLGDLATKYRPNIGTYKKAPVFSMISSRDCSHGKCIFCFHTYGYCKTRYRSPQNVVDEMEFLVKKYKAKEIKFLDDTFTSDKERVHKICEEIRRRKLKVSWYVSSRADAVDFELLKDMKKSGCYAVLFGVESGVQKNLDTLKKNVTIECIRKAVSMAKKAKLKVSTPFIFGIPGETYEEGLRTIDFAIELNADMVNFHTLTPYPGTELYNNIDRYGTMTDKTEDLTFETGAFVPFSMTREEILNLKELGFKRFYCRPSYVIKRILSVRSRYDFLALLYGAKAVFVLISHPQLFQKKYME